MWYYVDSTFNIVGSNSNDMIGNTGWEKLNCEIIDLYNVNGVPLYKIIDGKLIKRGADEILSEAGTEQKIELTASIEDRTSALESALLDLILGGAV